MPNVLSPRDLVSRPDNIDETVPHTISESITCLVPIQEICKTQKAGFLKKYKPMKWLIGCGALLISISP